MPCSRPAFSPQCPGPDGALERQCAWCRRESRRANPYSQIDSDVRGVPRPTVELKKYQWTDQYLGGEVHTASIRAVADPAVRFTLPLLREKTATLVRKAPTPRFMLHLSQISDREIGLLTDANGGGNLYLTIGTATGVGTPDPKKKFRFLAHTHPTHSTRADQITRDMANATDHVEVVVTMGELVVLFSEGKVYNPTDGGRLKPVQSGPPVGLDTPLTVALFDSLTQEHNPPRTFASASASVSASGVNDWWADMEAAFKSE